MQRWYPRTAHSQVSSIEVNAVSSPSDPASQVPPCVSSETVDPSKFYGPRVRFAPSPTGYLHIGGARTALFNWLYAHKNDGAFILRVEDTDAERTKEDSISQIQTSLAWLGITWDEGPGKGGPVGPYFQSQRRDLYRSYSEVMLGKGAAYKCYCTPQELERRREEDRKAGRAPRYDGRCRDLAPEQRAKFEAEGRRPALRLRVPDDGVTVVHDLAHGDVEFENALIGDFVIMKSDGFPTYNYACVIDDALMHISLVMRADEHLSNTPKQILMYQALGFPIPQFAHVPMILAPDRSKLSKRHGATSVEEFRDAGYLPEAIVNYLAFLGWTPGEESELLSLEQMAQRFSVEDVSKTPAIYDVNKLTWMNGLYMRVADLDRLAGLALPYLQKAGVVGSGVGAAEVSRIKDVLVAVRERVRLLSELPEAMGYFFKDDFKYDEKGYQKLFTKPGVASLLAEARERLSRIAAADFGKETTEAAYREVIAEKGISGGDLIHPTRLALTGRTVGPGLFDVMALLGRDKVLARLDRAVEVIGAPRPV
ncbi:MAG: glutamate--tRNA ligase [Firmicutes bacterium]|nr:glutamate--tRNA ligase [Bacillota bacterium]